MTDLPWGDRSPDEIAWAAGFFDGEGSVFFSKGRVSHPGRGGKMYTITSPEISIAQICREPLDRFALLFDVGSVAGPYKPRTANHNVSWRWTCGGRPSVHKVMSVLWPYLCEFSKDKGRAVWRQLAEHRGPKSPPLPELPQ